MVGREKGQGKSLLENGTRILEVKCASVQSPAGTLVHAPFVSLKNKLIMWLGQLKVLTRCSVFLSVMHCHERPCLVKSTN